MKQCSELNPWLLKAIATSVGDELVLRFGKSPSYTSEQIQTACEARGLDPRLASSAQAMFSEPGQLREFFPEEYLFDRQAAQRRAKSRQVISGGYAWDTGGGVPFGGLSGFGFGDGGHGGGW